MVGILVVKLGKNSGSLEELEGRSHEGHGVPVLNGDVFQSPKVDACPRSFLPAKKNPPSRDEEDGQIRPATKDSPIYFCMASLSGADKE